MQESILVIVGLILLTAVIIFCLFSLKYNKHGSRLRFFNHQVAIQPNWQRHQLSINPQTKALINAFANNKVNWAYWAYQKADKALAGASGIASPNLPLVNVLLGKNL